MGPAVPDGSADAGPAPGTIPVVPSVPLSQPLPARSSRRPATSMLMAARNGPLTTPWMWIAIPPPRPSSALAAGAPAASAPSASVPAAPPLISCLRLILSIFVSPFLERDLTLDHNLVERHT